MSLDRFLDDPAEETTTLPEPPQEAPEMKRRRAIGHPYGPITVGNVVYVYNRNEGVNGYYTPRNRSAGDPSATNPTGSKSYFQKFNSYAISLSIIGKLQAYEVERIFVLERETKDLYEFTIGQYLDGPEYVNTTPSGDEDRQKCPDLDDAIAVWRDVSASDLWV